MSITGNYVDAPTALVVGLVNHVVAARGAAAVRAGRLAADIVSNDQMGVRRMRQTYDENADLTGAGAWTNEDAVSREWEGPGFDPASIAERRLQVTARGRAQVGDT